MRFTTIRKCSKMGSLDLSHNQNGISIRFSSRNANRCFNILNCLPALELFDALSLTLSSRSWERIREKGGMKNRHIQIFKLHAWRYNILRKGCVNVRMMKVLSDCFWKSYLTSILHRNQIKSVTLTHSMCFCLKVA